MADAKGLNPGDPGYDPGSDPNAAQPQSGQAPVTGPGGTWAPPSSQDPAYLNQYKQVLAHLPSAGWSPGQTDPNYWVNRIASTNGGWDNQGNVDYFFGREMMGPNGQPGDSGNGNLPGTPAQALGNLPVSGFAPPMFTLPPAFTLPTEAQAAQQPGYKFSLDQGEAALEQSKAAQGVLNSGGIRRAATPMNAAACRRARSARAPGLRWSRD